MHPGTDARLSVWRERKAQDIRVKIALVSDEARDRASPSRPKGPSSGQAERLGLTVRVADRRGEAAGADRRHTGGRERRGSRGGGRRAAGRHHPGRQRQGRCSTTQELMAAAKTAGKTIALLVQRQGQQLFLPLHLN